MLDQLRKMGVDVHPHIWDTDYDFCGGTPFDTQRHTVELLTENQRAYCLNSMGTGKTKAGLWAYDFLRRAKSANRMLVVAPLSGLQFTWGREIFRTVPQYRYNILHGSREKRFRLLAEEKDIYIINHDGLEIIAEEVIRRKDIDLLLIDELAVYRNRTKRTRVAEHVAAAKPIAWGFTGAPMPNSPTDVFQQAKIITPHTVPKYFSTFRDTTMIRINQFKWVPKRDAVETALRALQPNVRFTLDDVVELPSFISRTVDIEMGPKQKQVYAAVKKDCFALLQSGAIRAANAGAVMSKLLQVSLGWVYMDDGSVAQLDNDRRNDALLDILRAARNKVLVFVPFTHALNGIKKLLDKEKISNEMVYGGTPHGERDRIFHNFQNSDDPMVIEAHPECMAHSITLTRADTVIWYGPITSAEIYDQANARIRRVGQKHKQLFLHLQATPAEKHIYGLTIRKIAVQDMLLKLLEDESRAEYEGAI
jgi:SNF2 family DNA or RNA helicase